MCRHDAQRIASGCRHAAVASALLCRLCSVTPAASCAHSQPGRSAWSSPRGQPALAAPNTLPVLPTDSQTRALVAQRPPMKPAGGRQAPAEPSAPPPPPPPPAAPSGCGAPRPPSPQAPSAAAARQRSTCAALHECERLAPLGAGMAFQPQWRRCRRQVRRLRQARPGALPATALPDSTIPLHCHLLAILRLAASLLSARDWLPRPAGRLPTWPAGQLMSLVRVIG